MKKLGIFLGLIILIVAGVGYYVVTNAGSLIKQVVESTGPEYLGAAVSVGNVQLSLTEGICEISDLQIGNPAGFEGDYALRMKKISVILDTNSLGEDVVVIKSIKIAGASLHAIMQGTSKSNLKQLMKNVDSALGPETSTSEESDIRIIIDQLDFVDAEASVSSDLLGSSTLDLPDLHLKNIGSAQGGATPGEVIQQLLKPITASVLREIAKQNLNLGDVEEKLDKVKKKLKGKLKDKLKGLGIFGHPESK